MGEDVRAELEELFELGRLEQRDGALSDPLATRRCALEGRAAGYFERQPIPPVALEPAVRAQADVRSLIPHLFSGWGGCIGALPSRAHIPIQVFSAIGVGIAGVMGPLYGRSLELHLADMIRGPLLFSLIMWGFIYPVLLTRAENQLTLRHAGFHRIEESLGVMGAALIGGWLAWHNALLSTCVASGVIWVAIAFASISMIRPLASARLISRMSRLSYKAGLRVLSKMRGAEARRYLQRGLILASSPATPDMLAALRVAILMEAEKLRVEGQRLRARALLYLYGVDPLNKESFDAVSLWMEKNKLEGPEYLEATGLHLQAAQAYRAASKLDRALKCYEYAASLALNPDDRTLACCGRMELGDVDATLLGSVLEDIKPNSEGATRRFRMLSSLPENILEKDEVLRELSQRLAQRSAEQSVSILESLVGPRSPFERPGLYSLLADAYRRLGHLGTARRIESELGPRYRPRGSMRRFDGRQISSAHTSDLAEALGDRYCLVSQLGSGAMGEVHLAEDTNLGRRVALKVLKSDLSSDLFAEKFRAEARVVAGLDHPGIVRVFDAGQSGPWMFFVMEFVDGPDLGTIIEEGKTPSLAHRLRWGVEIAEAMAYAHTRGVIHRDLKPANVLVSSSGRALVTDFGIARLSGLAPNSTAFSRAGMQVGTPSYMAPEQLALGAPADALTDVYALGVTLYFLVSGDLPFDDDPLARIDAPPPSVRRKSPHVSDEVERVVAEALDPDRDRRLRGMKLLAERLRGSPELAEGSGPFSQQHLAR